MIELPTLYSVDAKGGVIKWSSRTEGDIVIFEHGTLHGKMTINKTRCKGTNEGRANARSGAEQAEFEAQAAWTKKIKRGYRETIEAAQTELILLPMLAHPVTRRATRGGLTVEVEREFEFPIDVQLKYNGLRGLSHCLTDGEVRLISRESTEWEGVTHIRQALAELLQKDELADGEIYRHLTPLQKINSLVKVECPETLTLWYQLYDLPSHGGALDFEAPWSARRTLLEDYYTGWVQKRLARDGRPEAKLAFADLQGRIGAWVQEAAFGTAVPMDPLSFYLHQLPIQLSPVWRVHSREEIEHLQQRAVQFFYEGLILRQLSHPYTLRKRKESLLKWKDFKDGEFKILDGRCLEYFDQKAGTSYEILDIFVVQNDLNNATFEVKPRGTIPEKREMWENLSSYIGELLTVRYPERSIDDIPQGNPVGFFREEEDLPDEDDMGMWE